jgi:8-oxo-dGTP pyrophosphatase MutT (NUDIX family)
MVVRHHKIDAFSGALVFPGGKLEEADGDPRLRARCGGADKISADELKFRVAGVREAFEECGILLARKPAQRAVVGAVDLKGIEARWRAKLTKDEASIRDLVEAEDLELATDLMTPFAHWITPTFAPKRFDTWFFLAEAPEDQIALHDGSESVDSVWIQPQQAIAEATAGRRTLVHATTKNLELLSEARTGGGGFVAGQPAQGRDRAAVGRGARRQALPAHPGRRGLSQSDARDAAGFASRTVVPFAPSGPAR